jgi:hypothetical protein
LRSTFKRIKELLATLSPLLQRRLQKRKWYQTLLFFFCSSSSFHPASPSPFTHPSLANCFQARIEEKEGDIVPIEADSSQVPSLKLSYRVIASVPVPGFHLYSLKTSVKDVVKLQGSIQAGEQFRFQTETGPMVATIVAKMLDKGKEREKGERRKEKEEK